MTITQQRMTLAEYFNFDDGTDQRYELEDGNLLVMPPESDHNQRIAVFLLIYFHQLGVPFHRLRIGTEVVVSGSRSTVRLPDLMILTERLAKEMEGASRATVKQDMSPPQ